MQGRVLVALGGNAILKHGEEGTAEEQIANVRSTCGKIVEIIRNGHSLAITHGNGPQVGDILLKNEAAKNTLPQMPLDICGAESQGMLGYMLQQSMHNELKSAGTTMAVTTVLTQTIVNRNDPAFAHPTKPIGPFYTAMEAAKLRREKGWTVINDAGRGYRRVVPSPSPIAIVEADAIRKLLDEGILVIASGGGGIPVVKDDAGILQGVDAVIDKDHSAALLAHLLGAEVLLILTDIEKVSLNYGTQKQVDLDTLTAADAKKHLDEGQFPPGSMGPKIESAISFLKAGGKRTVITSLERAMDALRGNAGTTIAP
jgi:carbamate kinase